MAGPTLSPKHRLTKQCSFVQSQTAQQLVMDACRCCDTHMHPITFRLSEFGLTWSVHRADAKDVAFAVLAKTYPAKFADGEFGPQNLASGSINAGFLDSAVFR